VAGEEFSLADPELLVMPDLHGETEAQTPR